MAALSTVLKALADELEIARGLTLHVEDAICEVSHMIPSDSPVVGNLQQVDRVVQHLAALRDFVGALSASEGTIGDQMIADGGSRISLQEVRVRLMGADHRHSDPEEVWEEV